jgi:PKD repeat protein
MSNSDGNDTKIRNAYINVSAAPNAPMVSFTGTPLVGNTPLTVQFTDNSTESPNTWDWDFGDGSTHGNTTNPSHVYTTEGNYSVSLTATNLGGSNSTTRNWYISTTDISLHVPVASFASNVTAGIMPLSVQFNDTSTQAPTSRSWNFGDGNTSTAQNPTHRYNVSGSYTVALNATNEYGSSITTHTIAVYDGKPTTSFLTAANGRTITFTDTSGWTPTSWSWNFGDGNTSVLQSPVHTYANTGQYTVTLNASNAYGNNTASQQVYVYGAFMFSTVTGSLATQWLSLIGLVMIVIIIVLYVTFQRAMKPGASKQDWVAFAVMAGMLMVTLAVFTVILSALLT